MKQNRKLSHLLKAILKRLLWCSWKKADVIKSENLVRLSQLEDKLSSIERKLAEKQ